MVLMVDWLETSFYRIWGCKRSLIGITAKTSGAMLSMLATIK